MGFFGNSMPGYGGGMFPADNPFGVPDYMGGINEALAQNAALGQQQAAQPKKGFGEFLRAWAGHLGDNLSGNPAYANSQQARAQAEQAQRQQEAEKAWWYEQQQYKAANEKPEYDADIREFQQLKRLGYVPQEMSYQDFARMKNPGMQAPVMLGHDYEQIGGGNETTATNPQTGEKIRFNPQSRQWEPIGGPSLGGSGGFPRPY